MPDDDPIIIAFCLGLIIGMGLAMAIVVWKIRHLRRTPPPPPINQPIAILHPLTALKAVSKDHGKTKNRFSTQAGRFEKTTRRTLSPCGKEKLKKAGQSQSAFQRLDRAAG